MATMFDYDDALSATISPAPIMISVAAHFGPHTAPVMIPVTVHLSAISVTMVAITAYSDTHLFGACKGRHSNSNSSDSRKNVS
jgi:hypothetical protein